MFDKYQQPLIKFYSITCWLERNQNVFTAFWLKTHFLNL